MNAKSNIEEKAADNARMAEIVAKKEKRMFMPPNKFLFVIVAFLLTSCTIKSTPGGFIFEYKELSDGKVITTCKAIESVWDFSVRAENIAGIIALNAAKKDDGQSGDKLSERPPPTSTSISVKKDPNTKELELTNSAIINTLGEGVFTQMSADNYQAEIFLADAKTQIPVTLDSQGKIKTETGVDLSKFIKDNTLNFVDRSIKSSGYHSGYLKCIDYLRELKQ